jgi:hypothetical protein
MRHPTMPRTLMPLQIACAEILLLFKRVGQEWDFARNRHQAPQRTGGGAATCLESQGAISQIQPGTGTKLYGLP